jgi:hypothetical protein
MKITIIPADGAVYKDNVSFSELDLSCAPADVHALQWFGEKGWIEFSVDADFNKPANQNITELPVWVATALTKWDEAQAALTQATQATQEG